jgi:NO-binding membrane sensor protein with MHYT domain
MHFIGMPGFALPVPVSYDVPRTLLSLAIAILSAGLSQSAAEGSNSTPSRS